MDDAFTVVILGFDVVVGEALKARARVASTAPSAHACSRGDRQPSCGRAGVVRPSGTWAATGDRGAAGRGISAELRDGSARRGCGAAAARVGELRASSAAAARTSCRPAAAAVSSSLLARRPPVAAAELRPAAGRDYLLPRGGIGLESSTPGCAVRRASEPNQARLRFGGGIRRA